MKTEALNKCLDFFRNWRHFDESSYHELLSIDKPFGQKFCEPFRRELLENLLAKISSEEKRDLIVFYIYELSAASSFVNDIDSIEHCKIPDEEKNFYFTLVLKPKPGATMFIGVIHHLYVLLFYIIQDICLAYQIPFLEIIQDGNFDIDLIDTTPSLIDGRKKSLASSEKSEERTPLSKITPVFVAEYIPQIFEILKDFFSKEDQDKLLEILQNGGDVSKPLFFKESGNRLADVFKQLIDNDIILGCPKKELEAWIGRNFLYRFRDQVKGYTPRYLSDIISSSYDKCQKPILNTKRDNATGNLLIIKQ